jgi:hypothetical protein
LDTPSDFSLDGSETLANLRSNRMIATVYGRGDMVQRVGLVIGGTRAVGKALVAALADHRGDRRLVYFTDCRERDGAAVREELTAMIQLTARPRPSQ